MSRMLDRWNAIARLLLFGDERGTISERAEEAVAEAHVNGTRIEAEVENFAFDMHRDRDVLRDLVETFHHR